MVGPLIILFDLVMRQIVQGYSNSGRFVVRPSMIPFLAIRFSLEMEDVLLSTAAFPACNIFHDTIREGRGGGYFSSDVIMFRDPASGIMDDIDLVL